MLLNHPARVNAVSLTIATARTGRESQTYKATVRSESSGYRRTANFTHLSAAEEHARSSISQRHFAVIRTFQTLDDSKVFSALTRLILDTRIYVR
jgi:hypothetical protein